MNQSNDAGLYNNELQDKDAEAVQDALVNDYGVVINECTPEDKKELISMCESFYEMVLHMDGVMDYTRKFRILLNKLNIWGKKE